MWHLLHTFPPFTPSILTSCCGGKRKEDCACKLLSAIPTLFIVSTQTKALKAIGWAFSLPFEGIEDLNQAFGTASAEVLPTGFILGPSCSGLNLPLQLYLFSCRCKPFTVLHIIPIFYCFCVFVHAVFLPTHKCEHARVFMCARVCAHTHTHTREKPFFTYMSAKRVFIFTELNSVPLKFTSTWKLRMWPYLEISSLQMRLVKIRSYWIRVDPYPMIGSLIRSHWKHSVTDMRRRMSYEDSRDWSHAAIIQGTPGIVGNH